jgi:AcrR family transcriptional regulator
MPIVPRRKYEQRLRAESAEATRHRILEAAERGLREAPAQPLTVDRIARLAGVSRSTVYLVFGSRAGLFDELAAALLERAGIRGLVEAVASPDARDALRGGIRAGAEMYAGYRDVARALYSMALLDPKAFGGAMARGEDQRARGTASVARRLAAQGHLRDGVGAEEAAQVLWVLTSFDAFDLLYTGKGLPVDEVVRVLTATAERALCR